MCAPLCGGSWGQQTQKYKTLKGQPTLYNHHLFLHYRDRDVALGQHRRQRHTAAVGGGNVGDATAFCCLYVPATSTLGWEDVCS